jgi:hypothetical protein
MEDVIRIIIGVFALFLGIPVGNLLAHYTKDEMKDGQIWFRLLVLVGIVGGIIGWIIGNDVVMFSLFFISVVSSRSLKGDLASHR